MVVEAGRDWQRTDTVAQVVGRRVLALTRCDKQADLRKNPIDGARLAVIPTEDALSGVASADEPGFGVRTSRSQLARDVDEETAFSQFDVVCATRGVQHFETLLERRAVKFFVWINARDDADNLVHQWGGRVDRRINQSQMRTGRGIERAGKNSESRNHNKLLELLQVF